MKTLRAIVVLIGFLLAGCSTAKKTASSAQSSSLEHTSSTEELVFQDTVIEVEGEIIKSTVSSEPLKSTGGKVVMDSKRVRTTIENTGNGLSVTTEVKPQNIPVKVPGKYSSQDTTRKANASQASAESIKKKRSLLIDYWWVWLLVIGSTIYFNRKKIYACLSQMLP